MYRQRATTYHKIKWLFLLFSQSVLSCIWDDASAAVCVSETNTTLTDDQNASAIVSNTLLPGDGVVCMPFTNRHTTRSSFSFTNQTQQMAINRATANVFFNFLVYWTHTDALTIRLTFISFFIDYCGYQVWLAARAQRVNFHACTLHHHRPISFYCVFNCNKFGDYFAWP